MARREYRGSTMEGNALVPCFIAGLIAIWFGVDFLFVRDLDGSLTYYGSIPQHYVDDWFGSLSILAGIGILYGMCIRSVRIIRPSFVLSAAAYAMYGIGRALKGLVEHGNANVDNWFSATTIGLLILLLAMWTLLGGLRQWSGPSE